MLFRSIKSDKCPEEIGNYVRGETLISGYIISQQNEDC